MLTSITAIVVVLIPPAVEPEEPPTNINIIMINCVVSLIFDKSTVLNPAVRAVTDWNNELKIVAFPCSQK